MESKRRSSIQRGPVLAYVVRGAKIPPTGVGSRKEGEPTMSWWFDFMRNVGLATLGSVGGGILGATAIYQTWHRGNRESTARHLLSEALRVQALQEAWIPDGPNHASVKLSDLKTIPTLHDNKQDAVQLSLRGVEVRAVLDDAPWDIPAHGSTYHSFRNGRRAWIVRDTLDSSPLIDSRPALLSSRGVEELCGWVEQVAIAWDGCALDQRGLRILTPLLRPVAACNKRNVLKRQLSNEALKFLEEYESKGDKMYQPTLFRRLNPLRIRNFRSRARRS